MTGQKHTTSREPCHSGDDCLWSGPLRARWRWACWLGPIFGLASLIWFLVRVIPKPSRAAYPCQRAAFPLASSFVLWLAGLLGSLVVFRRARRYFTQARLLAGVLCLGMGVGIVWVLAMRGDSAATAGVVSAPNMPLGVARGAQPGRVVWIHDPNATDWEGYNSSQTWSDDVCTDPVVVRRMVSRAIRGLAGCSSDSEAWNTLFRYFNLNRGKGDVGYTPGQKIAIKINNTLCYNASTTTLEKRSNYRNNIDTSPQMIAALLGQLVNIVGAAQADITIGDPGRIMPGFIYDRLHPDFPHVRYLSVQGGRGRTTSAFSGVPLYWSTAAAVGKKHDFLPRSFAEADYFINFAILKSHDQGGITVCGKNLYGTLIRNPNGTLWGKQQNYYDMHTTLAKTTRRSGRYRALVDLMGHRELGGKTLLYLVDSLFAGSNWDSKPIRWNTPPFNADWPSSLFVSQDPVAIDSVCYDFLWIEWNDLPRLDGADDYLLEAALADAPPSGTFYDPEADGSRMDSLGVYERWNDPLHKQYSRNLGTGQGIELTRPTKADFNGDSTVQTDDLAVLCAQWLTISPDSVADIDSPCGDGRVTLRDFAAFARSWRSSSNVVADR
jgi:uncharacterized protein (DUF362 family)